MSDIKTYVITGEVMWAKVFDPKIDKFGKTQYSVDIQVSDDDIKHLKDNGLHSMVRVKDVDGKKFMSFKRKVKDNEAPLLVVDHNNARVTKLVGNGSTAKISISMIPYDNDNGQGVMMKLTAVKVLDHKEYVPEGGSGTDAADDAGAKALGITDVKDII